MPIHFEENSLIVIRGKPTDRSVNEEIERYLQRERYRLRGITREGDETFFYLTRRDL